MSEGGAGPAETGEESEREMTFGEKVWEQVSTLGLAIVIALAIRAVVIEPYRIPSGSMLPTLLIGDHLFVNKFLYGAQIPFTHVRLPAVRAPERGDIVVFRVARGPHGEIAPADVEPLWRRDDFVKRVVGLPGDRIEVRPGGEVWINGERMASAPNGRRFVDERGVPLEMRVEQLGVCEHLVVDDPRTLGKVQAPYTIPEGRYFMMGDNRDNSQDSRAWGTVALDDFKGPAFILYWSWNHEGNFLAFLNPVNWFRIPKRWDRMMHRVRCGDLEAPDEAGLLHDAQPSAFQNRG
ncbi:MAG: signal peptidase I [Myxococcota bacterium]|nr:signal peptidase I [Myxococcales bacterium]